MSDKTFDVKFRRRREGKTNYLKRLASVRSGKVRIVVRKTNKQIIAQAIKFNFKGDETIAQATSKELDNFGFYGTNNTPSAYLTGLLLGKRMTDKEAILDIGMQSPSHGSVIFACLKGVIDAGISIPHSKTALPSEDRLNGTVLDKYAKENADKFKNYEKKNVLDIAKAFEKTKAQIEKQEPVSSKKAKKDDTHTDGGKI
ncbi:MAG: 50S ribosomal protein L18 [archaeon]|jgi:large subunit ribosomal protein L18